MKGGLKIGFFDSEYRWLLLFLLTFAVSFYWLPEQVPLFYSQALPEEKLASKYSLLILPLLVWVFFIVSKVFLHKQALENENMLSLIRYFRIGLAAFCYLTFIRIILLVI